MDLEPELFWDLEESIGVMESQEMLRLMKISDFPSLKPNKRRDLHSSIYKQAYPRHFDSEYISSESKPLSTETLANKLRALTNG